MIVMRRLVEVDGKVRSDASYPSGLMDVVRLAKVNEVFRVLYDVKGRFVLHELKDPKEAGVRDMRSRQRASRLGAHLSVLCVLCCVGCV